MKTANKDYELATIDKNVMSNDYTVDGNNRLDSLGKTPVRNEDLKIDDSNFNRGTCKAPEHNSRIQTSGKQVCSFQWQYFFLNL